MEGGVGMRVSEDVSTNGTRKFFFLNERVEPRLKEESDQRVSHVRPTFQSRIEPLIRNVGYPDSTFGF